VRALIAVAALVATSISALAADTSWTPLFNGKDLSGWQQAGPGHFVVENGMLKTVGGMGLLWYTREKVGNAIIRVRFRRTHPKDDSGVFIRIPFEPTDAWGPVNHGYEVEIGDWPDDYSCTGALYTISKALARPEKPVGEWNTMEITLAGPRTIIFVNGVKVTEYSEGQPTPPKKHDYEPDRGLRPEFGYIGLQNHATDSTVYFSEVAVHKLQ
jgi:hypothetical protein